jgi:hypothetical protein
MIYYIDENNEIYAYPKDCELSEYISNKREISIDELFNYIPSPNLQFTINSNSQKYLNETDWYITRFVETRIPIPQSILDNRENARSNIIRGLPNAS